MIHKKSFWIVALIILLAIGGAALITTTAAFTFPPRPRKRPSNCKPPKSGAAI